MAKKKDDINLWGTVAFLSVLGILLFGLVGFEHFTSLAEFERLEHMTDKARDDVIRNHAIDTYENLEMSRGIGKFIWELINIPVPLILVVLLLIAILPHSAKTWKGGKK